MNYNEVFSRIEELKSEYVEFWREFCDIESPSAYKAGVDAAGQYVIDKAKSRGWKIKIHEEKVSGNAISITMNPDSKGELICFSGHLDTVHPVGLFGNPPTKVEGNIIRGPGVSDCKGGIVAAFLTMAALDDCGYNERPLKLILQSDEEVGSSTSEKRTVKFMAEEAKEAVAFFNCESTGPSIKTVTVARKGIIRYQFDITGEAVHSSRCYEGANAVLEAAHKIIELEKWKDKSGITCNCGVINGGTTPNTVAEKCTFYADIRYLTAEDLETAKARVREIADTVYVKGCRTDLSVKSYRINMERTEKNVALANRMNEIFKECGFSELEMCVGAGGSDAADMTSYGIPCVDSFATCGGYIHSEREYAFIDSLEETAKRLAIITIKY